MLPLSGNRHALDDDGQDHCAPDSVTTATHSSPISTVRTPPDFCPAVAHVQHQHHGFAKQLDTRSGGTACFDLDEAAELHAYHARFEMAPDPFGLDASLFSI
jgi:hypothetical protein